MAKDALHTFADMLYKEASTHKKETAANLEAERSKQLKETDKKLGLRFDKEVKTGMAKLEHQLQLSLTRREMELHKTLLQNRQRTFDGVFAAVEENVRAFTKTPAYESFLQEIFFQVWEHFNHNAGKTICTIMAEDQALAENLFQFPNLEFQCSDQDFIGGFTLENTALHYFSDCTLLNRIEEQKQAFYQTSGLMID